MWLDRILGFGQVVRDLSWALLVPSTAVVVSCCPSSLDFPLASPLEFPYPLDCSAAGSFTSLILDLPPLLRLPHHLLPLSSVVAWLDIWCMSDPSKVWVNSEDLEELCRAATQLASTAVRLASTASTQIGNQGVGSFVEIAREAEPEGLKDREWVWRTKFDRIAEDGPPDVPRNSYLTLAVTCSLAVPIRHTSALVRLFVLDFGPGWQLTLSPHTNGSLLLLVFLPIGLFFEWEVISHKPGLRISLPLRSTSKGHLRLCWSTRCSRTLPRSTSFCHAARIFLPRCLVWRSTY